MNKREKPVEESAVRTRIARHEVRDWKGLNLDIDSKINFILCDDVIKQLVIEIDKKLPTKINIIKKCYLKPIITTNNNHRQE